MKKRRNQFDSMLKSNALLILLLFILMGARAQTAFLLNGTYPNPSNLLYQNQSSIGLGITNPSARFEIRKTTGITSSPNPMFKITSNFGMETEGYISFMGYGNIGGIDEPVRYGIYQNSGTFYNVFQGSLFIGSGATIIGQTKISEGLILDADLADNSLPSNRYIRSRDPRCHLDKGVATT